MSGEKAVAINRAWEQWPTVDPEAVAEMVAAGWDAHAAQVVPQPDREAIKARLSEVIGDVYSCSRVWEAWQYGTMTQDDFSPAWEDEELLDSLLAALSPAPLTINRDDETELQECIEQEIELGGDAGSITAAVREFLGRLSAQTVESGKPQRLDPELRADLIEFARARIESVWADVPGGADAATLAHNIVSAQEFCWMSRQIPVSAQTVEGEVEWGVRGDSGPVARFPESSARTLHAGAVRGGHNSALMRRTVGPWIEVQS